MKIKIIVNGVEGDPTPALKKEAEEIFDEIGQNVISRSSRIVNSLRNSALEVLGGTRSGASYRKPGTYVKKASNYYQASAPGEPPAPRTGSLRRNWNPFVSTEHGGGRYAVKAGIESGQHYARYLEDGTSHMAPRPYVERILERSKNDIESILSDL